MKNRFGLALLCFTLFFVPANVGAKEKTFITEKLDQATNQTQLSTKWLHFGRSLPSIDMQALYSYSSNLQEPTYPDYISLNTIKWSHDDGKSANSDMKLTLNIDGEVIHTDKAVTYLIEQRQRGLLKESATFKIPASLFHKITTAAKVDGHLGNVFLPLSQIPQFTALKQLCDKVDRFSNKTTVSKAEL